MSTITVYAVAAYRSFDNYYADFIGFSTDFKEVQTAYPDVATQLTTLEDGKILTFRIPYVDHHTPDEIVVLRTDVPVETTKLHIQYIRWKYAGLTMSASTGDKQARWPPEVDGLNDCVYNITVNPSAPTI